MRQYLEVRCHLCAIAVGLQSACMASRRKSYTLDFKRRVVSSLTLNEGNVSATAKMHGIHRKLVQSWRKQHAELEKLATGRDTTGRKRRRLLRTPKDGSSINQTMNQNVQTKAPGPVEMWSISTKIELWNPNK